MSRVMKDLGYDVILLGKSHLYEAFDGKRATMCGITAENSGHKTFDFDFIPIGGYGPVEASTPEMIQQQVTSLLDSRKNSNKPMFLIFASNLPHGPYVPTTWPDGYYNNIHLENEQLEVL